MKANQNDISKSSTEVNKDASNKTAKSAKTTKTKKPNKFIKFFKDLKSEIKKVVWPSKQTVWKNTGVVIVAMIVSGIFVWGIDSIFKLIFDVVLKR